MGINLKSEIYISWIPRGQIEIKPEIYASVIIAPKSELIKAGTRRNVSTFEFISIDSLRKIAEN